MILSASKRSIVTTYETTHKISFMSYAQSSRLESTSSIRTKSSNAVTINKERMETFTNISTKWWHFKIVQNMNAFRVKNIKDGIIMCPIEGKKILDVGCGGGMLSEDLAKMGGIVTGIDPCEPFLQVAKEHRNLDPNLKDVNLTYECTTIEEHSPKHINHYDIIIMAEVIDHLDNKELFLSLCLQTLKPGGKIYISAPNKTISNGVLLYLLENITKAVPKGAFQRNKFISLPDTIALLEEYDCRIETARGTFCNPLTLTWSWSMFKALWFVIVATKIK